MIFHLREASSCACLPAGRDGGLHYLEPKSLKEAAKALAMDLKGSVVLAGGTNLLVNMKQRVIQPKRRLMTIKKATGVI